MLIGDIINKEPAALLYKEDPALLTNDCVGVELELENITYSFNYDRPETPVIISLSRDNNDCEPAFKKLKGFWKVVKDGSLRKGTEFIFAEPLSGANISEALSRMQSFLDVYRRHGKPVSLSDRTSVHVHLDVRDLNDDELMSLVLVYMLVERVIFKYINPFRSKNTYCRPLTDSSFKYSYAVICKEADRSPGHFIQAIKHHCDKYSALNVLPTSSYGSVEFRHHHGTSDMSKVKEWINIILAIKRTAKGYPIKTLLDIYSNTGPTSLLTTIFKWSAIETSGFIMSDLYEEVDKGVNDVNEILNLRELAIITENRRVSKVRPENTLIHQFKKANNLLKETV